MKTIAAVVSVYGQGSHSDVLLGKFLPGRGIPRAGPVFSGVRNITPPATQKLAVRDHVAERPATSFLCAILTRVTAVRARRNKIDGFRSLQEQRIGSAAAASR